jgi:hypothetical protein
LYIHYTKEEVSLPGLFSEYLAAGAIMLAYCFDKTKMLLWKRFVKNTVVGVTAVFLLTFHTCILAAQTCIKATSCVSGG